MFLYEKLSNENFDVFNKLTEKANNQVKYRLDFYKEYDKKSFINKYFLRKFVRLIKYNNVYIGYIWLENQSVKSVRINDMYILEDFLDKIDNYTMNQMKSDIVIYEMYENQYSLKLINKLKFNRYKLTFLMKMNLNDKIQYMVPNGIFYRFYSKKTDRKLRCAIQNSVFRNEGRVPLNTNDIMFDEEQDYYINDLCIFIMKNNIPIGYGQIIYSRGIYSIVNIGILEGYRGFGYGKALVYKLIDLAYEKNIKEIYIRVESINKNARYLYESIGFKEIGVISNWIWNKK